MRNDGGLSDTFERYKLDAMIEFKKPLELRQETLPLKPLLELKNILLRECQRNLDACPGMRVDIKGSNHKYLFGHKYDANAAKGEIFNIQTQNNDNEDETARAGDMDKQSSLSDMAPEFSLDINNITIHSNKRTRRCDLSNGGTQT